jgi:HSP20 family protein
VTGYRSGSSTANAYATPAGYEVQIALPGMKSDSITVTVEKNWLKVKAESGLKTPEQGKTIWQSFGGPAEFTIQLPSEVESGQAQASYDAGVLTVTLPKAASLLPHTIKVSAN